jgi:amino acid permease
VCAILISCFIYLFIYIAEGGGASDRSLRRPRCRPSVLYLFMFFIYLFILRKEDIVRDAIAAQAALWGGCVMYLFILLYIFFLMVCAMQLLLHTN